MKSFVPDSRLTDSQTTGKEKLLPLYNHMENIPVTVFFKVLNSGNKNLLNPEKKSLRKTDLNRAWDSILDDYHQATNKKNYLNELRIIKRSESIRNKLVTVGACILLLRINPENEVAAEELDRYNIATRDDAALTRIVAKDNSQLKLLDKKRAAANRKKQSKVNFWKLVADVEKARGFNINVENMVLARWVAMLNSLKEMKPSKTTKNGRQNRKK